MRFLKNFFPSDKLQKDLRVKLSRFILKPNKLEVKNLLESNKFIMNSYSDSFNLNSILINSVNCLSDFHGSNEQIELIDYLIDQGSDVDWLSDDGYNSLHIALSYHSLSKISLLLIREGNPDVNIVEEKNGNSPIFIAVREYTLAWGEEQKEINQLRFEIIKELLNCGADLDIKNKHGISAKKWLERIPENDKLHKLIKESD